MAKMQKATLDPAKISGYCGRLKCCLRYEDNTYSELKKKLPRKNSIVKTAKGQGRVLNTQILTQLVVVEHQNGERIAFPVEEIEVIGPPEPKKRRDDNRQTQATNKNNGKQKQAPEIALKDQKQQIQNEDNNKSPENNNENKNNDNENNNKNEDNENSQQ